MLEGFLGKMEHPNTLFFNLLSFCNFTTSQSSTNSCSIVFNLTRTEMSSGDVMATSIVYHHLKKASWRGNIKQLFHTEFMIRESIR